MESFFMNTRSKRILSLFFPSSSSSSSIPEPLSSSSFKTPDCISNPSNREAVLSLSSSLRSTSSVRRRCASLSLQDSQEDIHPTSSSSSSSSSSLSSSSCRFSSLPLLCSAKRSFLYRRSHFSPWSFRFSFLLSSKFILLQFLLFLCCFLVSLLLSLSSSSSVLFFSPGFSSFTSSSSSFFFYPPHVREATPSRLSSPVNKSLSSSFSIFPSSVVFSPEAIASPITFAEATPNLLPSSSLLSSSSSLSYGLSLALLSSAAGGLVEPSLLQGVSAATKDKQKNRATGKAHTREIRKSKQNKKKKSKKKEKSAPATRHKPRVVQVVRPNERHTGLEIDEEALAYIEAIPAPVSIVTAVGSIHTGKSFFLSQLLAFSYPEDHYDGPPPYEVDLPPSSRSSPSQRYNSTSSSTSSSSSTRFTAFPVGYTVHPGTQGLSFWSEPLRVDRRTGRVKTDYDDEDEEEEDREGSDYEDEEEEDDVVEGANKRRRRGSDERKEEETGEEDEEEEEDDEEDDQEEDDEDVKRTMNRKGRDKKASSSENIRKMKRRNEEQTEESDEDHITNVLLLDTEGFGGPNVTRSYDQLLYAVSSLMSSEILFTTMKMIDAQSLQFLEDLTRDANLFNLRAHAQSVNDTRTIVPSSSSRFSSSSFSREEPRSEREGEDQGTKELDSWTSPSSSSSEKSDQEKNTKTSTNEHTDSSSSSSGSEQRGSKPRDRNEAQETAVAVSSSSSLEEYVASSSLFSSLTPCCLSWIVQDFVQDLEGHTALQWLERLIDTNRWSASAAEVEKQFWREKKKERGKSSSSSDQDGSEGGKSTQLGHSLRSFYTSVDCVALPAPSASSDALQRLDLLPLSEMTAVYKSEFQAFKEKLLKRVANNYKVKNTLFHPSPGGHRIDDEKKKLLSSLSKQPQKTKRSSCSRRATSSSYQGKPGDRSSSEKEEEEARGDLQCETERGEEEDREEEERQHARGDNEDEKRKGGKNEKLRNLSKEERSSSSSPGGKKGAKTSRFYGLEKVAMSGKDVAALLKFLVRAANLNMFEDIQIFMNHFSTVRSDLAKNDLLLLFEEDMQKFLSVYPPPLPPLFFSFSESLRSKLLQQWQQQIQGQEGLHAQRIQHQQQDDMIKQLNEKVDRFRLIAGEQVRKYCRSFCEKQFRELHARVQEQQQRLPISPQTLAEWATYEQRLHRSLLTQQADQGGRKFSTADVCEDELRAYDEKVENLFLFLHKENTKKITAEMQRAEEASILYFADQLKQHPLELFRPLEQFKALIFEWKAAAWEIFEQRVEDVRGVRQIYTTFEQRLSTELKRLEQQAIQQWEEKCTEVASDVLNRWSSTYKAEVIASFPRVQSLPVDEDIFAAASQNKIQDALDEMNDLYCAKTSPWKKIAQQLQEVLVERQRELEVQNVEAIKINCKEPLDRLLKKLKKDAESHYLWTSFSALARREALDVLSSQNVQSRATVILSDRLIKKVTEHWLSTDVRKTYRDLVWQNLTDLLQQIVGTVFSIGGTFVFATYSMWLGSLIVLVGLWLVFGIFTLLACLRSAFKFTVQGLWTGLQDRVGLEAAVGIFFACAAVAGAVVFRWYLHRSSRLLAYSTDMPRSSARDSASSYMTHRDTVRASETPNPQQTVYPTPVGASVFGNTTGFMHDSLGVDGDRSRNRYSTMYCG